MKKHAYYNEIDPYAAQWLRNLIAANHIAPGDVDERSIKDVKPDDLKGYTQCHFFAGIGGWSYALRLAGWPDDELVWTGSCPCQPFSGAGKQQGFEDERHLWSDWLRLISKCRPARIFGEQVDAAIKLGWLDTVFSDLENENYACGAAVLPACGVGAPHIRKRLWFVGHANEQHPAKHVLLRGQSQNPVEACGSRAFVQLGDTDKSGPQGRLGNWNGADERLTGSPSLARSTVEHAESQQVGLSGCAWEPRIDPWSDIEWLPCTDGKSRPVEPGTFPLAHGVPARVAKLCALGNAIVPQVAAAFIKAYGSTVGLTFTGEWGGLCACGKKESDGIRCKLGATHQPKPALPWETSSCPTRTELRAPWSKSPRPPWELSGVTETAEK